MLGFHDGSVDRTISVFMDCPGEPAPEQHFDRDIKVLQLVPLVIQPILIVVLGMHLQRINIDQIRLIDRNPPAVVLVKSDAQRG